MRNDKAISGLRMRAPLIAPSGCGSVRAPQPDLGANSGDRLAVRSFDTTDRLRRVSTATLTTQLFKRVLRNAFMQGVRPLGRYHGNLVGPAFTLRNIPAREDVDNVGVFSNPEHPQRKAIEITPEGHVLV